MIHVFPKPDREQKKFSAEILSDLGKLFFAVGVVGYFLPGIGGSVSAAGFAAALLVSLVLFSFAISHIRARTRGSPVYEH